LAALKQTDSIIRKAFDLNLISFNTSQVPGCEADYMDVYNAHNQLDLDMSIQSVKEGLQLFQHTWGFASKTAIAPCYYWHSRHEEVMHDLGVELLQVCWCRNTHC
jgi:hypothetical protein